MSATVDRTIRFAMKEAGQLQEGDDPNSEQFAEWMTKLGAMISHWATKGLKLFLQSETTLTLVAGQSIYQLGGSIDSIKPLRVLQAYFQEATSLDRRPLTPISRDEYTRLGNLTTLGSLNSYFVDKAVSTLNVSLWNTPDTQAATGSVVLLVQRQFSDITSLTQSVEIPDEWFLALYWGLAALNSGGQPVQVQQRNEAMAERFRTELEDWDVEDASTSFQPDPQAYRSSRFA